MMENVSVLITEAEINRRLDELAAEISKDFAGKRVVMVGALKGAVIFMVDLARKLQNDVEFDFINVSSYGDSTSSSRNVRLRKDLDSSIHGKHVLLVEDIVDSGHTLAFLKQHLSAMDPDTLKICALLDKPDRRETPVAVDYLAFTIPDEFVVGYGLDYAQRYRNLPYIGVLHFVE